MSIASYLLLSQSDWEGKIAAADALAVQCCLCPRKCGVNRHNGETGFCKAPGTMQVSSVFPHHGEEPPLSGTGGSGTVFFSWCTLRCDFCQNFQISQDGEGETFSPEVLAKRMIALQHQGCHNINLVTASHFLPWVLRALQTAAQNGLDIPIVYNCGGYESPAVIDILDSIVDIWLPDMKYGGNEAANKYSHAADYVQVNQAAIRTMFRQVGPLRLDSEGIAKRGLCIRHLVLPAGMALSENIAAFLSSTFDPADINISLMAQYRPLHRACGHAEINRVLTAEEYEPVKRLFIDKGFGGFYQEVERMDSSFVIDFTKRKSERLEGSGR